MSKKHEIKCKSEYFEQVQQGTKTFEIRKNDRDYSIGDVVKICEIDNDGDYTGNVVDVRITYVLTDVPEYGLESGFCIFCWNPAMRRRCRM